MLWIYATSVGALTYDYAVRTLQFSGVSHNIVDVPVLNWLSNDELGDYVACSPKTLGSDTCIRFDWQYCAELHL